MHCLSDFLNKEYIYPYFLIDTSIVDARPFQWQKWDVRPGYTYLVDPVTAVPDSDVRRRSRKCHDEGFYINEGFDEIAFHRLFTDTASRQQIQMKLNDDSFIALLQMIRESGMGWMMSAYDKDHRLHASWIQMSCDSNNIYNWNAASSAELLSKGGTPFLVMNLLEKIRNSGYKVWDLCGADNPSVARFKSTVGGTLTPYFKVSFSNYSVLRKMFFKLPF
jgi:hypothetical protein